MDPLEKKRLANERRLKAIQDQKLRNQKSRGIAVPKIDNEISKKTVQKNQIKLFDSEGEEENIEEMFKIRPQFEGRNGLQLLEMSSKFSSRFKLDERFKDDNEDDEKPTKNTETEEEKDKNFKILESILGYEVSKKLPDKQNTNKKRCIDRFDPENEDASKYIKQNLSTKEPKKNPQKKKKKVVEEKEVEPIPISKERYIEVSSNLKDLFQSSSTFSFSSKFGSNNDQEGNKIFDLKNPFSNTEPKKAGGNISSGTGTKKLETAPKVKDIFENKNIFTFFVQEDDTAIQEGLAFFVRSKPLEEIRESWTKKKDDLAELYRMKKKSFTRRFVNKKPTTQGKRTFIKK